MGDNVIGGQNIICLNDVGGRTNVVVVHYEFPHISRELGGGGGRGWCSRPLPPTPMFIR